MVASSVMKALEWLSKLGKTSRNLRWETNVGVHGKPVTLHMEKLWDRNISLTTRLVDTVTPLMLLKMVASGKLQPHKLVTHSFAMEDIVKAYDTFGNAAEDGALKVVLKNAGASPTK